jgi:hypothetical protein
MTTLAEHWNELASVALLGVDRRPVPPVPSGDIEALLDRVPSPDPAGRLLAQVAALSAARRAGLRPNPPVPTLRPVRHDRRVVCPPTVAARLAVLLDEWPDLLPEFLDRVGANDWRLTPDMAVVLLARVRRHPQLRATVQALTGPLADWLTDLFPEQFRASKQAKQATPALPGSAPVPGPGGSTPPAGSSLDGHQVAIPADISELLELRQPPMLAAELARRLQRGTLANRNRSSLQILIRQLDRSFLAPIADALRQAATNPNTMGVALSLGDLAHFRLSMIQEFDR